MNMGRILIHVFISEPYLHHTKPLMRPWIKLGPQSLGTIMSRAGELGMVDTGHVRLMRSTPDNIENLKFM